MRNGDGPLIEERIIIQSHDMDNHGDDSLSISSGSSDDMIGQEMDDTDDSGDDVDDGDDEDEGLSNEEEANSAGEEVVESDEDAIQHTQRSHDDNDAMMITFSGIGDETQDASQVIGTSLLRSVMLTIYIYKDLYTNVYTGCVNLNWS